MIADLGCASCGITWDTLPKSVCPSCANPVRRRAVDALAGGGGALPTSPPPVGYAANPQLTGLAPAVRPRATGTGTSARGGIEIESIRGDKRETVSY